METPRWIRRDGEAAAACARRLPFSYLLLATPLSLFLYINTFKDAWTFFAGHSDSLLIRHPSWFVAAVSLLGAGMLACSKIPGRRWWTAAWIAIGISAALLISRDTYQWGRVAAFALCIPGWIALREWVPPAWQDARKPDGTLKLWLFAGLLLVTAAVLSSIAHAVYNLLFV